MVKNELTLMINTRTAFRGEDNCRGEFTMTETDVRWALRVHNKGASIHPILRKLARGRFGGSPLRTPSQCNEVCICNERPVGKTKSVPTNTLVVNQISLLGYFRFPRAAHQGASFPPPDGSGGRQFWESIAFWGFQVATLQVPLFMKINNLIR